jgi:hypothetical protein
VIASNRWPYVAVFQSGLVACTTWAALLLAQSLYKLHLHLAQAFPDSPLANRTPLKFCQHVPPGTTAAIVFMLCVLGVLAARRAVPQTDACCRWFAAVEIIMQVQLLAILVLLLSAIVPLVPFQSHLME